jgi:hypothetical protein
LVQPNDAVVADVVVTNAPFTAARHLLIEIVEAFEYETLQPSLTPFKTGANCVVFKESYSTLFVAKQPPSKEFVLVTRPLKSVFSALDVRT